MTLRVILPDTLMKSAGLKNAFAAQKTVARYYCTPLTLANKCPLKCEECATRLQEPVERLRDNRAIVRSPMGTFIWSMRTLVNTTVETMPKITVKKDRLGIPEEKGGNVWDKILAGL